MKNAHLVGTLRFPTGIGITLDRAVVRIKDFYGAQ